MWSNNCTCFHDDPKMPPMKYMYTETHLNELDTWICNVVTLQDSSMVFWKSSVKEKLKKWLLSSFQESERPSVERVKMRLRNQDLNHVTTHTFTLNRSITHTFTGLGIDQIQVSLVFETSDSCKWQMSPAPPLPPLDTHRAVFSTPVNDKTMLLCYLTAAADCDYSPVEAWCLSSAGSSSLERRIRLLPLEWIQGSDT